MNYEKTLKKTGQRRREAKEKNILDTAMKMISENGIDNFSINKLADNLDYTPGALYRYFPSKDSIIAELEINILNEFRDTIQKAVKYCEQNLNNYENILPIIKLRLIVNIYLFISVEIPEKFYFINTLFSDTRAMIKDSEAVKVTGSVISLIMEIGRIFTECENKKLLNKGNIIERTIIFVSSLQGILQLSKLRRINPNIFTVEKLIDNYVISILSGWGSNENMVKESSVLIKNIDLKNFFEV